MLNTQTATRNPFYDPVAWERQHMAEREARTYIGKPGQRVTATVHCKKIIEQYHPKAFDGDTGISYLHICEDTDHNVVIYRGVAAGFPLAGETATLTFTIKKLGTFRGVPQTHIQRPRLTKGEK